MRLARQGSRILWPRNFKNPFLLQLLLTFKYSKKIYLSYISVKSFHTSAYQGSQGGGFSGQSFWYSADPTTRTLSTSSCPCNVLHVYNIDSGGLFSQWGRAREKKKKKKKAGRTEQAKKSMETALFFHQFLCLFAIYIHIPYIHTGVFCFLRNHRLLSKGENRSSSVNCNNI